MSRWLRSARVPLLALALFPALAHEASAATLFNLGGFAPSHVNNKDQISGDIVDFTDDSDNRPYYPGVWQLTPGQSTGSITHLAFSGVSADANFISESGRVAGTALTSFDTSVAATHAVSWASPTASAVTGTPRKTDVTDNSYGLAVDNAGHFVGQTRDEQPYYATAFYGSGSVLSPIGRTDVPTTGTGNNAFAPSSEATGITPDGNTVLGHVEKLDDNHPASSYLWSPGGGSTKLGITPIPSGDSAFGGFDYGTQDQNDLASDGTVLGYTGNLSGGPRYLRINGSLVGVSGLAGYNAVNAKHTIAGTMLNGSPEDITNLRAAIRKPNGDIVDLNSLLSASQQSTVQLFDALTINDNGDVAGIAFDKTTHAGFGFLLKLGYVVDSTGDDSDKDLTDSSCLTAAGTCTLRAAIEQANHDAATTPTSISFNVAGLTAPAIPKIAVTKPLPAITVPVEIDGTTQPKPLVAGGRTIGAIIDGTGAGANATGLELASGAAGSLIHGVQVQTFTGDGVKLGGASSQLAGSVLYKDRAGAEVAANGAVVGAGNGLPGNVFFEDNDGKHLLDVLKGLTSHAGEQALADAAPQYGAGVLMTSASSGAQIKGNLIGVHGPGFTAAPENFDADGPIGTALANDASLIAFGVMIAPKNATISNVTVGGSGADANTISGTGFGMFAMTDTGGQINGLSVLGNTFGKAADGGNLSPFGGIFGLAAMGKITGLQVGAAGAGNTFQGEVLAALVGDQDNQSPQIKGNVFGDPEARHLPKLDDSGGIGAQNLIGLILPDAVNAQVGSAAPGDGNQFVGSFMGLILAGDHLSGDTISGNTIGSVAPKTFGSFAKTDVDDFSSLFGVLYSGNAVPGKNATAQNVTFDHNAIQGNVLGMVASGATGMTMTDNSIVSNAISVIDGGSGGTKLGTAGHGNTFADAGIGLMMANADPTPEQHRDANVNPDLDSTATKDSAFTQTDEDVVLNTVNAISTATLGTGSAATSTVPGTNNSVLGNTFGTDASGATKPVSLPLMLLGDEHSVRVGGLGAGEGNTISHSRAGGLWLLGSTAHPPTAQILGNTIFDNENFTETNLTGTPGLGIDLATVDLGNESGIGGFGLGVNPQDQTQPDAGANGEQNAPVLTSATTSGNQLTVSGTLHGIPNTNYLLEVFDDDNQNPFGAGEGQRLLGRPSVTTDGAGNASFSQAFAAPPSSARFVSATATTVPGGGAIGVTSEFAVNVQITAAGAPPAPTVVPAPGGGQSAPSAPSGAATTGVTAPGGGASVRTSGLGPITIPAVITCSNVKQTNCTVTTAAKIVTTARGSRAVIADAARAATKKSSSKSKAKTKSVTVGAGSSTLAPGATGSASFTLNAAGKKLLVKQKTLTVTVTVTVGGSGRTAVTKTFTTKLKYVAPKQAKQATKTKK